MIIDRNNPVQGMLELTDPTEGQSEIAIIVNARHAERKNENDDEGGLTRRGHQQAIEQAGNFFAEYGEKILNQNRPVLILYSPKPRTEETMEHWAKACRVRVVKKPLPILSNANAAKMTLWRRKLVWPILPFLLGWLWLVRKRLPPSPRSIDDIQKMVGIFWPVMNWLMNLFAKEAWSDVFLEWAEFFNREGVAPYATIIIGSEVSQQVMARELLVCKGVAAPPWLNHRIEALRLEQAAATITLFQQGTGQKPHSRWSVSLDELFSPVTNELA